MILITIVGKGFVHGVECAEYIAEVEEKDKYFPNQGTLKKKLNRLEVIYTIGSKHCLIDLERVELVSINNHHQYWVQ